MRAGEKYLRNYLKIAPLGLALWRAVEAKHLSKIKLGEPILDIGCGFGEFGVAFGKKIDMGIDMNPDDLAICAKTGVYKNLTLGDARDMPFASNTFGAIFSISTFEHIPHPERVLKESYRILKPGGLLFLTLETDEVDSSKFFTQFLDRIGQEELSKRYIKSFNQMFHRHSLLPKSEWVKMTKKAGFSLEKTQDIISPTVTALFDLFLITSWPSQIAKKIIGKRIAVRPGFMDGILLKVFGNTVSEEEKEGTNLLIIARKPLKQRKK